MTALLESIDLFIAVFNAYDNYNNFDPGQAYKYVRVKPTLTQTKSDPNDSDNPDDLTHLQRWYKYFHLQRCAL